MRAHLASGGLILAATHSVLGLDGARELQLDQASLLQAEGQAQA
jgi:ABC-type transport system involved in cytochrome c biogenesis ATPase subunit